MIDDRTVRAAADKVASFQTQLKKVREDHTLSPAGKREKIGALYSQTSAEVEQLRGASRESSSQRARVLERRLFGINSTDPTAVVSYRDASDRVSRVRNAEELAELMEQADASGDTALLRAGFSHAARRSRDGLSESWGALVAEYLAQTPSEAKDFEEYAALTSSTGLLADLAAKMQMSVPRPDELNGGGPPSDVVPPAPQGPDYSGLAASIGRPMTTVEGSFSVAS